jgi:general secretion pathway protein H
VLTLKTTTGQVRNENEGGIRFDPDGSSTGGRIELGEGPRKIEIGVDWLTGRVSVVNAP